MWAVFEVRDDEGNKVAVHIAPCDSGGWLSPLHGLIPNCRCHPEEELNEGCVPIYIHHHLH